MSVHSYGKAYSVEVSPQKALDLLSQVGVQKPSLTTLKQGTEIVLVTTNFGDMFKHHDRLCLQKEGGSIYLVSSSVDKNNWHKVFNFSLKTRSFNE